MTRTRYAYDGMPGTYERGNKERSRQDTLVQAAGGMCAYLRGAKPRDTLTTAFETATMCGVTANNHHATADG